MKASEYITELSDLMLRHGDLECVDSEDTPMDPPEYVTGYDDDPDAFVLAGRA
jgi:hypothetical protein